VCSDYGRVGRFTSKRGGAVCNLRPERHSARSARFTITNGARRWRVSMGQIWDSIEEYDRLAEAHWRDVRGRPIGALGLRNIRRDEWSYGKSKQNPRGVMPYNPPTPGPTRDEKHWIFEQARSEDPRWQFPVDMFNRAIAAPDRPAELTPERIWRYLKRQNRGRRLLLWTASISVSPDSRTFPTPERGIVRRAQSNFPHPRDGDSSDFQG
jgi:hypothetical protein